MDCLIQEKLLMSRRYVVYLITVMINVPRCAVTGNAFDFGGHSGRLADNKRQTPYQSASTSSSDCGYLAVAVILLIGLQSAHTHGHLSDKPNKQKHLGDKWQRCTLLTLLGKSSLKGKKN